MAVRVYFSTNRAAVNDTTTLVLDSATQGQLDTDTIATSDWYEVPDMVQAGGTRRGRGTTELDPCGTGGATLTLLDPDGVFDPLHRQSPLWPGVQTGMRVRITTHDDVELFTGRIDDTDVSRDGPFASLVKVDCIDEMGVIAQAELSPQVRAAELITDRIGWVLQTLAYTGDVLGDTAYNTAVAVDLTTTVMSGNAAKHLNELAASEGWGFLFADRSGSFRFLRRRPIIYPTVTGLPLVTFTDTVPSNVFAGDIDGGLVNLVPSSDIDGGDASTTVWDPDVLDGGDASTNLASLVAYTDFVAESLGKTLANQVSVTNRAGGTATSTNALSIQQNGTVEYDVKQAEAWWVDSGTTEANRQAVWIAGRLGDGGYGVTEVTVPTDQLDNYQRRLIAALELGDLVQVQVSPRHAGAQRFIQDAFVVGIDHKFSANGYGVSTTVRIAAATGSQYWSN